MQTEKIVDKRIHWKRLNDDVSVGHFSSCSPSIGHNASQVYVKSHQALGLDSEKSIKVFLLHDIGQHHGRYQSFIDWARRENPAISFVAMDFVGHGLSSGTRGHFEKFDHLVNDFHFLLTQMEKKSDDSEKWIVIGHGLGGLVALDLVNRFQDSKEHRIDGLVLSNFIFQLSSLVFQLEDQMLLDKSTIRKIIGHTRPVRPFKSEEILSAPEDVLNYEQDPLLIHRPTLNALKEIQRKMSNVYQDSYFLDNPLMLLKSTQGFSGESRGIDYFAKGIKKDLLTEKKYSLLKHDLYNEKDKEKVFSDIMNWIKAYGI